MTEPTPAWESDEGLLMLVQDALNAPDAVPPAVKRAAYDAFTWRTIDAELASLAEDVLPGVDSAGVDSASVDSGGVDPVGVEAAGLEAAGLEAVGVEAAGVEAAGLEVALTRSVQADVTALTLASPSVTFELQVLPGIVLGQMIPAGGHRLEVQRLAGRTYEVPVDDLGCFTLEPAPGGLFRLRLDCDSIVTTSWISLP